MMESLWHLVHPSGVVDQMQESDDVTRNARVLSLVLRTVFAFVVLNIPFVLLLYVRKLGVGLILLALATVSSVCTCLLIRGAVRMASRILICGLWCLAF